jgi:hypothetical protein
VPAALTVALGICAAAAYASASASLPPDRHLVYEFGLNEKAGNSSQGTGTMTVDIAGPATNGSRVVSASDFWWNTPRARATNTCDVYPDGTMKCDQRPFAISPNQISLFSLLGRDFFDGLGAGGHGKWTQKFTWYAAVIPGATGIPGHPNTWNCVFHMQGKGLASKDSNHVYLVAIDGTMEQQGGHYRAGTVKGGVLYDANIQLPVFVNQTRTRLPQTNVYNNDFFELKLIRHTRK